MLSLRPAAESDLDAITSIYNEAIENTTATFDTILKTVDERKEWLKAHDKMHPVIVAVWHNRVVGFGSLNKWSERPAYDCTAEVSFYVHHDFRGQGIGKRILERLTIEAKVAGLHTLISRITEGNESSLHLHRLFEFENAGLLKEVGMKFGRYLDVHIYQKVLKAD